MPVPSDHSKGVYLMAAMIVQAAFDALKTRYPVEWMDREKEWFCLSFCKEREYRICACEDRAELEIRKRFLCWEYWSPIRHAHYDGADETAADILEMIEILISSAV